MKQLTEEEIVVDTVKYYKNNNRGMTLKGGCSYLTEDKCMCAIGRVMTEEGLSKFGDSGEDANGLFREVRVDFYNDDEPKFSQEASDSILKTEYHGHNQRFWENLQSLHDDSANWIRYKSKDGNKLSDKGRSAVKHYFPNVKMRDL